VQDERRARNGGQEEGARVEGEEAEVEGHRFAEVVAYVVDGDEAS
jgi:hypothetical protein